MATVYTTFASSQNDALSDSSAAPTLKNSGGNVKYIDVTKSAYTAATADPLYLVRLPKGARLIPSQCSVDFTAPASTACTGKIGYIYDDATGDDDAFGASLALGTAASRKLFTDASTKGAAFLDPVTFTDDAWIYVTWTTVTGASSHQETWHIAYTLG